MFPLNGVLAEWTLVPLPLRAALAGLVLQVAVIGTLVAFAVVRRMLLNRATREDDARTASIEGIILDVLMAHMENPGQTIALPVLAATDCERFRRVLLSNILALKGTEHSLLVKLYVQLGLNRDDEAGLRSPRWWERLASVSAVESLGRAEGVALIVPLAENDAHPLVSLSALRALSVLADGPLILERVVEIALVRGGQRNDVLTEIFINVGRKDPSLVRRLLQNESTPTAALPAALQAASVMRDPELVDVLVHSLSHANPKVVLAALDALMHCGDPELPARLSELAAHSHPGIRAHVASIGRKIA